MLQKSLHAEIRQSRSEKHRRKLSLTHLSLIKLRTCTVQKLNILEKLFLLSWIQNSLKLRILQIKLQLLPLLRSLFRVRKQQNLPCIPVKHTLEGLAGTNRPVHRAGGNAKFIFNIIQKLKDIHSIPVHLIDKSKNRNMPHGTYLKQLPGLSLHTLRAVNHHHR